IRRDLRNAERRLCTREVEPYGEQVGTKPTNIRGMARSTEAIESHLGIVLRNDPSPRGPPSPCDADAHVRVRIDVPHISSLISLLGNDPTGRVLDMHADNGQTS